MLKTYKGKLLRDVIHFMGPNLALLWDLYTVVNVTALLCVNDSAYIEKFVFDSILHCDEIFFVWKLGT